MQDPKEFKIQYKSNLEKDCEAYNVLILCALAMFGMLKVEF